MDYFKRHKFDRSKFRLGMRTFKTGIAVFLVLLIFGIFGWRGLQIGALTAVFSLREDFDKSVHFGASRVMGNSIPDFCAHCDHVNHNDKRRYEQQSWNHRWSFSHAHHHPLHSDRRNVPICFCPHL